MPPNLPAKPRLDYHAFPSPENRRRATKTGWQMARDLRGAYSPVRRRTTYNKYIQRNQGCPTTALPFIPPAANLVALSPTGTASWGLPTSARLRPSGDGGKARPASKSSPISTVSINRTDQKPILEKLARSGLRLNRTFGATSNLEGIKDPRLLYRERICRER